MIPNNTGISPWLITFAVLGVVFLGYAVVLLVLRVRAGRAAHAWVRKNRPDVLSGLPWYLRGLFTSFATLVVIRKKRLITEREFISLYNRAAGYAWPLFFSLAFGVAALWIAAKGYYCWGWTEPLILPPA